MKTRYKVIYYGWEKYVFYAHDDNELQDIYHRCIMDIINNCNCGFYDTYELKNTRYVRCK